jgi:hypothetical protein
VQSESGGACATPMIAPTQGMPAFAVSHEVIAETLRRWSLNSCSSLGDLK